MKELETRIIKIDVVEIRKILVNNNAIKVKEENQVNFIYDFEDGRLLKHGGYARIRTIDNLINNEKVVFMTTKKLLSQGTFKEMEEHEVIVDDKNAAEGIYSSLGLILRESISKFRESYKLEYGLVEIDINDTNFCPFPYLEIETDTEENLQKILDILGYTIDDTTSDTIYKLIEDNK